MSKTLVGLGYCCAVSALVPAPASAQESTPAEPSAVLTEIIVTARKTTENLQRAPISVTAISSETIGRAGIKDPTDLQSKMPAVEFQTATSVPGVSIRGIGTYNLQAGVDAAVAYTVDGIYLAHPQAFPPVLVDIAQVEVVRGPQGTLYGRNSNGGAISFVTNKPVLGTVDATVAATVGNYDALGTEAMLNVPAGDKVAIRAAFASNRHDGYYANGYNDAHDYAARARVLYQPMDNLQIIATVDKSDIRNDGVTYDFCPPRSTYPLCATLPWKPYTGLDGRDPGDFADVETWAAYGEANLSLDWGTITALSSYRRNDWLSSQTYLQLGTSAGFMQGQLSKLATHELRIASPTQSRVKWIGGGYYSRETGPATETFQFGGSPYFTSDPDLTADAKAVFGQLTYPVIDALRLTGGLRYTDETKSAAGSIGIILGSVTTVPIDLTTRVHKVTWKAGVEYDIAPHSMLYGSASTGFKSGGVNQVPGTPSFATSYEPEEITAYQIGSKNRFLSQRLQVNAEAFYYDYKNFQTLQVQVDPTAAIPGFFLQTVNSQKATLYGGEIEIAFALSRLDRLSISGTLLHSRFDRFVVGAQNLSGNEIQAAPDQTLAASYEHIFELTNGGTFIFNVDSKWVASHYIDNTNVPGSYQTSYTRSGASLTYEDGHWSVSAFVRNIEDKAVMMTYAPPLLAPGDLVQLYPPRTYGLTTRWKF